MSKFDYMNFSDGRDVEFVAHAKKFTKEEAISLCIEENDFRFWVIDFNSLLIPESEGD